MQLMLGANLRRTWTLMLFAVISFAELLSFLSQGVHLGTIMDDRTRRSIERMQGIMRMIWIQQYACRRCKSAQKNSRSDKSNNFTGVSRDDTSSSSHALYSVDEDNKRNVKRLVICYDSSTSDSSAELGSNPASCDKMKQVAAITSKSGELAKLQHKPVCDLLHNQYNMHACCHKSKESFSRMGVNSKIGDYEYNSELESYMKLYQPQVRKFKELQKNMFMASASKKSKSSKIRGLRVLKKKKSHEELEFECTVCSASLSKSKVQEHPLLAVCICKRCKAFQQTCLFDKDEDGSEWECSWCGDGGEVICCGRCTKVFCQECIEANLGHKELTEVLRPENSWLCYVCNPKPLKLLTQKLSQATEKTSKSPLHLIHG